MKGHKIHSVESGSIAEELDIYPGDILLEINGEKVTDVFDYRFLSREEELCLLIKTRDGEEIEFEIEKDEDEDLGLIFENGLMDKPKGCQNKCIFCFIDQLPRGMRETLYFKDDDMRMSFLKGNYVTLTNMSSEEIDKIIYYHLSPINISVHATDPDIRVKMLRNKNAGMILKQIEKLVKNNIELNFQIVLCRDINDGIILDKTISDLSAFIPKAKSLSVVPVGISKERENNCLPMLKPFDKNSSEAVIKQINLWQKSLKEKHRTNFVYAADEFYIKAEAAMPRHSEYEGFPQLENGVGMISLMKTEFEDYLSIITPSVFETERIVTLVTGIAAYNFIESLAKKLSNISKGLIINVIPVENSFFGSEITVSGLLTGGDIIKRLLPEKDRLGETLFIPENALKSGEEIFLDDVAVNDLKKTLEIDVVPVESTGIDFINKLLYRRTP